MKDPTESPLLVRLATETPLLEPSHLSSLLAGTKSRTSGSKDTMVEDAGDGIRVISVVGVLARRPSQFEVDLGFVDTEAVRREVLAATYDDNVNGVLLAFDSPGGMSVAGYEAAEAVRSLAKVKPCVSWTSGLMCSLAYMIGSQARKVVATHSSVVGSIGAYISHLDASAYYASLGLKVDVFKNREGIFKAAGLSGTSLTQEQGADFERKAQQMFDEFKSLVLAARPSVKEESMRGQTFAGSEARSRGLVDLVGGIGVALGLLRGFAKLEPSAPSGSRTGKRDYTAEALAAHASASPDRSAMDAIRGLCSR